MEVESHRETVSVTVDHIGLEAVVEALESIDGYSEEVLEHCRDVFRSEFDDEVSPFLATYGTVSVEIYADRAAMLPTILDEYAVVFLESGDEETSQMYSRLSSDVLRQLINQGVAPR
jgi:hypothetical protein